MGTRIRSEGLSREPKIFPRIYIALIVLGAIILIGIEGYVWLEDYTVAEAFYMTIITVSTVGYGEVRELSDSGRIFTAILIITSFGTFAYAISAITSYVISGFYKNYFKAFRVGKDIDKLENHVIVCGYGRVGEMVASELHDHDQPFVLLERNEARYNRILENTKWMSLKGDATRDENLLKARIHKAKALITTLPDDAENLYVVLTARELNKDLCIISRASKSSSVKKLKIAGANNVIMPDKVGGVHMASLVVTPDVLEFLDHISIQGSGDINLEEVTFKELPDDFRYQTLGELEAKNRLGINIIGYKTDGGEYIINPGPDTRLIENSKLFVLGNPRQIKLLNRLLGKS